MKVSWIRWSPWWKELLARKLRTKSPWQSCWQVLHWYSLLFAVPWNRLLIIPTRRLRSRPLSLCSFVWSLLRSVVCYLPSVLPVWIVRCLLMWSPNPVRRLKQLVTLILCCSTRLVRSRSVTVKQPSSIRYPALTNTLLYKLVYCPLFLTIRPKVSQSWNWDVKKVYVYMIWIHPDQRWSSLRQKLNVQGWIWQMVLASVKELLMLFVRWVRLPATNIRKRWPIWFRRLRVTAVLRWLFHRMISSSVWSNYRISSNRGSKNVLNVCVRWVWRR